MSCLAHDDLTFAVASEQVKTQEDLLLFVKKKGWDVLRVGDDFITIKAPSGRRFRFRYQMDDVAFVGWVYGLVAYDDDEKACYIGSTCDLIRRMEEHRSMARRRRKSGRTSAEFFSWAKQRQASVKVIILDEVRGRCALALREAAWTQTAGLTGWILPAVDRWGARSRRSIATNGGIIGNITSGARLDELAFNFAMDLFPLTSQSIQST